MEEIKNYETTQSQSETIGKIALALSKAQGEFHKLIKDTKNPFYNTKYADLSCVIDATREALVKNEIAVIQLVSGDHLLIKVTTKLCHSSGEWIETTLCGKPARVDCQQQGSVITYLRRYSLASILNIAQEDDDGNAEVLLRAKQAEQETNYKKSRIVATAEELSKLKALLSEFEEDFEEKIKQTYKIKDLSDISKEECEKTLTALTKRLALKKEQ